AVLGAALAALAVASGPPPNGAQASSCAGADTNPSRLNSGEARRAVACLINERRANAGLSALDRDRRLQKAAQRHTKRMHGTGCFAHQCPGEGSLESRLRSTGYLGGGVSHWRYAENVGWGRRGRGTPARMVEAWMGSAPHRAYILDGGFRDLGVGFRAGTPARKNAAGGVFTVDFGLRSG
ncbi:MAG: CAP domain-containing protein, partial [Solirubrobacterales bacterium]